MKFYLRLQFTLINRAIRDFGMNPAVGYVLILAAVAGLGEVAFARLPTYAPYIIALFCVWVMMNLARKERAEFLHITFDKETKRKIRIIENLIVAVPLVLLLLVHNQYITAAVLSTVSVLMAFVNINPKSFVMPTPFSKKPFEFSVGFRNTFLVLLLLYVVAVIAVCVNNLNLGLFIIFALCFIASSYYLKPENEFYVWIFAESPRRFLWRKIINALKNTVLLTLPIIIMLTSTNPSEWWQILLITAVGLLFMTTSLLAKYSVYPEQAGFLETFFIFAIFIPPFVLVVIPFLYFRSIRRLKNYLND